MEWGAWDRSTEAALVIAAQAGDLGAFDRLSQRYRPALVAVAGQILRSRDLAEDAAQDALLSAYGALPQLDDATRFGGWIASIARNRAMRMARGERRLTTPIDEIVLAYLPSITADLEQAELETSLRSAIAELAQELRTIVELYYLSEWPVQDISRFLDLPVTTVKWRLHTARQKLRRNLWISIEENHERECE